MSQDFIILMAFSIFLRHSNSSFTLAQCLLFCDNFFILSVLICLFLRTYVEQRAHASFTKSVRSVQATEAFSRSELTWSLILLWGTFRFPELSIFSVHSASRNHRTLTGYYHLFQKFITCEEI